MYCKISIKQSHTYCKWFKGKTAAIFKGFTTLLNFDLFNSYRKKLCGNDEVLKVVQDVKSIFISLTLSYMIILATNSLTIKILSATLSNRKSRLFFCRLLKVFHRFGWAFWFNQSNHKYLAEILKLKLIWLLKEMDTIKCLETNKQANCEQKIF